MGNYVIRRQSDGEVYLAHAGTASVPKTERPGHKYILRLLTRAGARYFYTPEQVRAFYNSVKAKAGDPLGFKAYDNAMKKGMKVITTQGQENTAKWKVDKKPTAENKNNYERAKAANNYAQRDYYDAKKESEKGAFGKLSSALKGKSSGNEQKPDQNGRSRGQSNMYVTDKYGNTYRPGVISDKPKGGMRSVERGKEQSDKNDWKDNRPEGRKRNVTGKADPIKAKTIPGTEIDKHDKAADALIETIDKYEEVAKNKNSSKQDITYAREEVRKLLDDYIDLVKEQDAKGLHYAYNPEAFESVDEWKADLENEFKDFRIELGDYDKYLNTSRRAR